MQNTHEYKLKFFRTLRPFMDMLEEQRSGMEEKKWSLTVKQTIAGIIRNPEQYLGKDLPDTEILVKAVEELFEEFLFVNVPEESVIN